MHVYKQFGMYAVFRNILNFVSSEYKMDHKITRIWKLTRKLMACLNNEILTLRLTLDQILLSISEKENHRGSQTLHSPVNSCLSCSGINWASFYCVTV